MTEGADLAETPLERLRRAGAVVGDGRLTAGEVRVILAIVLSANRDGEAWPGQRYLRRMAHASGPVVVSALRKAARLGHIERVGTGPRGVAVWGVVEAETSAPLTRHAGNPRSAPDSRHGEKASARHVGASSAPSSAAQRATSDVSARHGEPRSVPGRCHETLLTNREPSEPTTEPSSSADANDGRAAAEKKSDATDDGNGHSDDDGNDNGGTRDDDDGQRPPDDPLARRVYDAVGAEVFFVWFDGATFDNAGGGLRITAANKFIAQHIRERWLPMLQEAAEGREVSVVAAPAVAPATANRQ